MQFTLAYDQIKLYHSDWLLKTRQNQCDFIDNSTKSIYTSAYSERSEFMLRAFLQNIDFDRVNFK